MRPSPLPFWIELLKKGTDQSFNRITVDGDTSTNDLILVMANGLAGNPVLDDPEKAGAKVFPRPWINSC